MMSLKQKIIVLLATGCYVGYIPFAPGTFGSLIGIPLVWCLSKLAPSLSVFVILLFIPFSFWIAGEAEKIFNKKDSGCIVIDEIAGMLVTFFLIPWSAQNILIGFVLFRIFDIAKPFPIGLIDRKLKGGPGVVMDDIMAGVYANAVLRLVLLFLPGRI
ncbi:MAG: phosphatidylglycerophosphatase A [Pseudomonadota bacterium]